MEQQFRMALRLQQEGELEKSRSLYEEVLKARPDHFDALHLLGIVRFHQGDPAEGTRLIREAIRIKPDVAQIHYNLGVLLQEHKDFEEAIITYRNALKIDGRLVDAHNNLGNVYRELNRTEEALACFRDALAVNPNYAAAWLNLAGMLGEQRRLDEAIDCYQKVLTAMPNDPDVLNNVGILYQDKGQFDEAVSCFRRAIAARPHFADALYNLGSALQDAGEREEAVTFYRRALAVNPAHEQALSQLLRIEMQDCDWAETKKLAIAVRQRVAEGGSFDPWVFLGVAGEPALQLQCAKNYFRHKIPVLPKPIWQGRRHGHERMRIAYLSADFHEHATSHLIAGLFEQHDRNEFEIIGISLGPDDHSEMRRRLVGAFDRFVDVRSYTDRDVAKMLNALEVDIAVDLNGFTSGARPGILAHRPAPVQINYLGYPGTMGADFIDYIIGDPVVTPFAHQHFYAEKIIQLPGCYQANDSKRETAPATPSRAECGLPDEGFVYCCFNKSPKYSAEIFAIWMRLLDRVAGSVLWLIEGTAAATDNLRRAAKSHGVDARRLIFAPRMKFAQHLARHRVADLFLDTHPVNAHTTASDALWAGLPLITFTGDAFAARVATSLLGAAGMPEFATNSLEAYETLALELGTNRRLLAAAREKLSANVRGCALFDTNRFRKNIEWAYKIAWEKFQRNEAPSGFAVGSQE